MRAVFFGLGSDGTVGANKNSIKIIGEETDNYAQGYFVYDSKKSGADDHLAPALRAAADPLHLPDQPGELRGLPPVPVPGTARRARGRRAGRDLPAEQPVRRRTRSGTTCRATVQEQIIDKKLQFFVIDAYQVARETGMGGRINTIMQTCFFAISGVLPRDEAIAAIKHAIEKTYGKRGEAVVREELRRRRCTPWPTCTRSRCPPQVDQHFDRRAAGAGRRRRSSSSKVTALMIAGEGDLLPVSALPVDGTFPTGTAQWEKRNIALEIPVWDEERLHPVRQVRAGLPARGHPRQGLRARRSCRGAAEAFKSTAARWKEFKDLRYTLQVAPEDCTGCGLCVEVCPAKNKSEVRSTRRSTWSRSRRSASRKRPTGISS